MLFEWWQEADIRRNDDVPICNSDRWWYGRGFSCTCSSRCLNSGTYPHWNSNSMLCTLKCAIRVSKFFEFWWPGYAVGVSRQTGWSSLHRLLIWFPYWLGCIMVSWECDLLPCVWNLNCLYLEFELLAFGIWSLNPWSLFMLQVARSMQGESIGTIDWEIGVTPIPHKWG